MMKKTILILLVVLAGKLATGQYYEKHFGVRIGNTTGFSFKAIKDERLGMEAIIGFRNGGMQVYGLVESYRKVFTSSTDGMRLFFGPGAHVGFTAYRYYNGYGYHNDGPLRFYPVLGLDAIVGLEYNFPMTPVVIAIDFKPFVELEGFHKFRANAWDFGIRVSYSIQ